MHGSSTTKGNIPLQDQHLALAILLELAVQRGTLRLAARQPLLHPAADFVVCVVLNDNKRSKSKTCSPPPTTTFTYNLQLCLSWRLSLQSAAFGCPSAAPPVGERHQGDGQRALHPGNQRPAAAAPAALPEHTQHQGGARP